MKVLPVSQIISRFDFSSNFYYTFRYISIFRCIVKSLYLEKLKQLIIWDGVSSSLR